MTIPVSVMNILKEDPSIAQTLLDTANTYREYVTPEMTKLSDLSARRLRYWVQQDIASCNRLIRDTDEYSKRAEEIVAILKRVDAEFENAGIEAHPEGWGIVKHWVNTKQYGICNMRDLGDGVWRYERI